MYCIGDDNELHLHSLIVSGFFEAIVQDSTDDEIVSCPPIGSRGTFDHYYNRLRESSCCNMLELLLES